MRVDVRARGVVDVLDVSGTPTGDEATGGLRARLDPLLAAGGSLFIVNLTRLAYADSAFLGELIAFREHVRRSDGIVKLVVVGPVRAHLIVSDLDRLFDLFDNEDDALDDFVPATSTAGIP